MHSPKFSCCRRKKTTRWIQRSFGSSKADCRRLFPGPNDVGPGPKAVREDKQAIALRQIDGREMLDERDRVIAIIASCKKQAQLIVWRRRRRIRHLFRSRYRGRRAQVL